MKFNDGAGQKDGKSLNVALAVCKVKQVRPVARLSWTLQITPAM